ncbi:MAG: hypothetical protein IPK76_02710 [Lewinellaceae bacterium]|nr:hypothetical protein [Lewinellaceae bacterium]
MSKNKGTKNSKKAPADKSAKKDKVLSDYKAENKKSQTGLDPFTPKPDFKSGGNRKS